MVHRSCRHGVARGAPITARQTAATHRAASTRTQSNHGGTSARTYLNVVLLGERRAVRGVPARGDDGADCRRRGWKGGRNSVRKSCHCDLSCKRNTVCRVGELTEADHAAAHAVVAARRLCDVTGCTSTGDRQGGGCRMHRYMKNSKFTRTHTRCHTIFSAAARLEVARVPSANNGSAAARTSRFADGGSPAATDHAVSPAQHPQHSTYMHVPHPPGAAQQSHREALQARCWASAHQGTG